MTVEEINKPASLKLHDLRCFDAVAKFGSFQAAADALHRSHPSIFAAVARLEEHLGLKLLDRSGYRVVLTEAGTLFRARAAMVLSEIDSLDAYARKLAEGEEAVLRVVLGDLCPRTPILSAVSDFFTSRQGTRLHLDYEAVTGPFERLHNGTADLIVHRADERRYDFEQISLFKIELIPVAAPGFLPYERTNDLSPQQLQSFTQCVIRDTAREAGTESHFLIDGAPQCSVPDHVMKKDLILHRMAWGHLPGFMISDELRTGTLISLQGRYLHGKTETLAAMRRSDRPHGPVARELWQYLKAGLGRMASI